MEKSKIIAIEPLLVKGQHQTWQKNGTTYYKFMITLEDGTNGTVLSKRPESSWQPGEIVTFEYNNGLITNIRKAEERRNGKSYYEDPKVQENITRNLCLKVSVNFLGKFADQSNIRKGDSFKLADKFFDWCYKDFNNNQQLLNKRSALERALECRDIESEGVNNSSSLISQAEEIMQWLSHESANPF